MSYNKETGLYEGFIYCITNTVNGKMYIGQTRMTVHRRWQRHVSDSKRVDNPLYRAMRKYGLDKFNVDIHFALSSKTNESLKNSLNLCEMYCIGKYKTLVNENGYNLTRGGDTASINNIKSVSQYDLKLNLIQKFNSVRDAFVATGIEEEAIRSNCENRQKTAGGYVWAYGDNEPIKPKYQFDYNIEDVDISKYDPERLIKLIVMGWNGKRVLQYNVFGEIINTFDDPLDAAEKLGFSSRLTYLYIGGESHFNFTTLLYEGDEYTPDKSYKRIKPVCMYDEKGNCIRKFSCSIEADEFLGVRKGKVRDAIYYNRICKGYYFTFYGDEFKIKEKYDNSIPVEMIDENNNVIKTFNCIADVGRHFNVRFSNRELKKLVKNHTLWNGYYWRYKDEAAVM